MNEITIESFAQIENIAVNVTSHKTYRGVSKSVYDLIPTIGRITHVNNLNILEHSLIYDFENVIWYQNNINVQSGSLTYFPRNTIQWMIVAQHYGIPTRLLDWTRDCMVALFFAIEKDFKCDGAIYIDHSNYVDNFIMLNNPNSVGQVQKFSPPIIDERIRRQESVFTWHPNPIIPYNSNNIEKIIIPKQLKKQFINRIAPFYNKVFLFPEIASLIEFILKKHKLPYRK